MEVFRLTREKYKGRLDGDGASIQGGRWNSKSVKIVYASGNRSLAMAEVAVHLAIGELPKDYFILTIYIPDNLAIKHIPISELPALWHRFPPTDATRVFGDEFISSEQYPILKVPSAITPGDFNYLMNPLHKDFSKIRTIDLVPFPFSPRILRP